MHIVATKILSRYRHYTKITVFAVTAIVTGLALPSTALAQSAATNVRAQQFEQAAAEFHVPAQLLLALSYNQSRWEDHADRPSTTGGYGVMHLTTAYQQGSGRNDEQRTINPPQKTLDEAAQLLNVPADQLKTDTQTNIRGAAALLAEYAKQTNNGQTPTSLDDWAGAIAKMRASDDADEVKAFVEGVYGTVQTGATATTKDQQTIQLPPQNTAKPNETKLDTLQLRHKPKPPKDSQTPECPSTIVCKSAPAYQGHAPGDVGDYGNYAVTQRPKDMDIKYIIIHDTEGDYQSSIDWFQNPASYTSAHYVIRSSDGEVTQTVPTKDVAWHANNWQMNMHSIGIEHEGFSADSAAWYSEPMYNASAQLVRYLAQKYNIPLDREHIIGHDQFLPAKPQEVSGMHTDPGPFWDWQHYMELIDGQHTSMSLPDKLKNLLSNNVAMITPHFQDNKQLLVDCSDKKKPCRKLPLQGTNFVYLRSAPQDSAPLLGDLGLHPDGSEGTRKAEDTSVKASQGQRFVIAEQQGSWTAIWFGGQKGWLHTSDITKVPTSLDQLWNRDFRITPKAGKQTIPIYGSALPEASAFPPEGIQGQPAVTPLQYQIKAGQQYVAYDTAKDTPTDYYYAWTIDGSVPHDHTVFTGKDQYIPISYNHRQAFVRASDVDVVRR